MLESPTMMIFICASTGAAPLARRAEAIALVRMRPLDALRAYFGGRKLGASPTESGGSRSGELWVMRQTGRQAGKQQVAAAVEPRGP